MEETPHFRSENFQVHVSDKIGSVSATLYQPDTPAALVILAHSAGSDMHQPVLRQVCEEFAIHNVATLRFNFPYRENARKMPDRYPVASATILAVIDWAMIRFPKLPVFCAGKSFGGRMSSMTMADHSRPEVRGLIFFGFPLHPSDKPSVERAAHLEKSGRPMLFFQGTKDKLAYIDLITSECAKLASATLVILEEFDHSMMKGKQSGVNAMVQRSAHWINQVIRTGIGDSAGHLR